MIASFEQWRKEQEAKIVTDLIKMSVDDDLLAFVRAVRSGFDTFQDRGKKHD